ncbi:MAG TPA: hypothetical protein VHM90_18095 [Phycisphaerae bacterium]|nr:hypothetical protein [Phycisphaerae bacterium]
MKLDEEQQTKAMWAVGIVAGLALLYFALVRPLYLQPREQKVKDIAAATKLRDENARLLAKADALKPKWKELQIPSGPNASEAMEASVRATVDAAAASNVGAFTIGKFYKSQDRPLLAPKSPDRQDTRTDFTELRFTMSTTTTTNHLAKFLNYIESTKMPARIESIKIDAIKSGIDNLNIDIIMSAIVYTPRLAAGAKPGTGGATATTLTGQPSGAGFTPGSTSLSVSLDPPLPEGGSMEERLKKRREDQLKAPGPESPAK